MPPEKISRYIIKKELGRGGMATVYQAYDPNFERDVAIKILPRAFLHDPQFRTRFEREAKTVAALEHPAIVPVYDFGEQDGQPYIVMRMMSGGDLGTRLKNGPLSLEEAVNITRRIGEALEAAHRKDIIHRDLKPGNILFDQYGNAFLTDFGIARIAHGSHTLTGDNIIGTPAYMSPEQIQGEKDLDGRSDLYSLGIIFYHMLTGNTPYQATTPAKVMMMHILEPVPHLTDVRPELPQTVELWLEKALAKDPDDRFATASEMIAALEDAMRGQTHPTLVAPVRQTSGADATVATTAPRIRPESVVQPPTTPRLKGRPRGLVGLLATGCALALIAVLALGGLYLFFRNRSAVPLSPSATASIPSPATATIPAAAPTSTVVAGVPPSSPTPATPPTETPLTPTDTPEPTATVGVTLIGGADKIAFINDNDIWLMNVDGSNLQQFTNDGAEKYDLAWLPDGSGLTYISGKCIWIGELESGRLDYVACFETADYVESFALSPDGTQAALAVNRSLYIVPYDLETLRQVRYASQLTEISQCPAFAPLKTSKGNIVPAKFVRWANDGKSISVMMLAITASSVQGDLIKIYPLGDCKSQPYRSDEFPAARFQVENYNDAPYLQNFGYDGGFIYALTSFTRNDGYGHLYLYNADLHRAETKANPIDGTCCYRDPSFSPDGHYLIFAYQPFEAGATSQLYIVPLGSIGTGTTYEPITLPEGFFANPRVKPQPVLRSAQPPTAP